MKRTLCLLLCMFGGLLYAGTATLYLENDAFSQNDAGYTNGIRFSYTEDEPRERTYFLDDATVVHSVFQHMYTPQDISNPDPQPNDRAWAGTLGYEYLTISGMARFGFQAGVGGPASGAGKTQAWIHDLGGWTEPQGWDNQLDNRLLLNLIVGMRMPVFPFDYGDISLDMSSAVGTTIVQGSLLLEGRIGRVPSFREWVAIEPVPLGIEAGDEWYLYAVGAVGGRAVAYNWTLGDDVDEEPLVWEGHLGVSYGTNGYGIAYIHTWRGPEFRGDVDTFGFGNLSFRWSF